MGSVGDSYDNALAETINGLYKTEVIRRRGPWRTLEAVEFATLEWVDWFNHRRLLEPIGNIPPAEAEARYYAQTEHVARAALLNQIGRRRTEELETKGNRHRLLLIVNSARNGHRVLRRRRAVAALYRQARKCIYGHV